MAYRFPAEWSPHAATWIAWPHHEPDWPGKLAPIPWVYAEIVRVLHRHERVEILCHDEDVREAARRHLAAHGVRENFNLHVVPNDRVWVRDSGPTFVLGDDGRTSLMNWRFNAWAKYSNFERDVQVGAAVERITGLPRIEPVRPDTGERVVLEGGAIDVNGTGTLLATEECLLDGKKQVRNPGLSREALENVLGAYLGVRKVLWLGRGIAGDDTHGHVDDLARFVDETTVVIAQQSDPDDVNYEPLRENRARLESMTTADGRPLRVLSLPMPEPLSLDGIRLPASYANFYIGNEAVIVPTFNDPNDRAALQMLAGLFPTRRVVGIHAVDLVWGFGTLHCMTQQQPAAVTTSGK